MHVAIAFDRIVPAHGYGGMERIAWWLGKALARLGHAVTLVVPPGSRSDFARVAAYDQARPIVDQIPRDVDLVHDFLLRTDYPVPAVTTLHGNTAPGTVLPRNTVFISHNQALRHGGTVVVHNGIDPEEYGPVDWAAPRSKLLFLAKASWRVKNVQGAIRIAHGAGRRLVVAGGHRISLNMGFRVTLDPRVRFLGMVGGEDKHRLLNRSAALLFPVRWHEPFGIAILESLYFGLPVFGTTYGSLPELITPEVGTLANSESALVEAVKGLERFDGRRCHEYVLETFSADLMALRYLELYRRVLDGEALHDEAPVATDAASTDLLPIDA
jgi:glycosyltransferase involved in cell wall biosynthesis